MEFNWIDLLNLTTESKNISQNIFFKSYVKMNTLDEEI